MKLKKLVSFSVQKVGEPSIKKEGFFHEWGKQIEEFESGGCENSVGIVEEKNTGKIYLVYPELITFKKQ